MADTFRDFIPEGEDTDGLGDGFRDFVPAKPKPVAKPELKPTLKPEEKKK